MKKIKVKIAVAAKDKISSVDNPEIVEIDGEELNKYYALTSTYLYIKDSKPLFVDIPLTITHIATGFRVGKFIDRETALNFFDEFKEIELFQTESIDYNQMNNTTDRAEKLSKAEVVHLLHEYAA